MPHENPATSATPARIAFVIDKSGSMGDVLATGERKIDLVSMAMRVALGEIVGASSGEQGVVKAKYQVAMFLYSSTVEDVHTGFQPISEPEYRKFPKKVAPANSTHTSEALEAVRDLLKAELPIGEEDPAPVVCHLTDGEYTNGVDPSPIAREIMDMEVGDGNLLSLNIFISDGVLANPLPEDIKEWKGVTSSEDLSNNQYARTLFEMSSPLPESFREELEKRGYQIQSGARMLFPGANPEMIHLGFAAATSTGKPRGR